MNIRKRMIPVTLIALVSFGVGGLVTALNTKGPSLHAQAPVESNVTNRVLPLGNPYQIADVAERVTPAVVFVTATWPAPKQEARSRSSADPFGFFFGPWFQPHPSQGQPRVSAGTGFIIDQEGHILTNQHVVGSKGEDQKIKVKISTGDFTKEVEAKLIGSDYRLDLAILQIEKPKELKVLPTIPLGDSDKSRPGEWVIAVGNPRGERFEHTVTVGVLSAKGREIQIYDQERRQVKTYSNLMQTDAAINPGNSGGPLLNINGEVIGINTAVDSQAQGIGFAIPINVALDVKDQLIHTGKVTRGWIGIGTYPVDEEVMQALGLKEKTGVIVTEVYPNSPAEKAGIRVYDVIVRINNTDIKGPEDFQRALCDLKPNDKFAFLIERSAQRRIMSVTAGEAPEGFLSTTAQCKKP